MHGDARGAFSQLFIKITEPMVFGRRGITLTVVALMTLFMVWQASQLKLDAGFEKQLPLDHPYIKVFKEYEADFGGANLVLLGMINKEGKGDIYNARSLDTLRKLTDAVFFTPGIDRTHTSSLFTPDVRYIEVVEEGFSGGNVIPADYAPDPQMFDKIRSNVNKAGIIGRLVSNDQTGAMVFSGLLEYDPATKQKIDYIKVAHMLEDIRLKFTSPVMYEYTLKEDTNGVKAGTVVTTGYRKLGGLGGMLEKFDIPGNDSAGIKPMTLRGWNLSAKEVKNPDFNPDVDVHVIGFTKVVGDIADAALEVVSFFALSLFLTLMLLWMYCGMLRIALIPLSCSVLAVIWELGFLNLFGYGLDPFAILVPFLVLSIGVSHGIQITSFWLYEVADHELNSFEASRATYRRLVIPGISAVLTNVVGFGTILLVPIDIVQEMAINAMFGLVAIIICKKILLPCLLSYAKLPDPKKFREHQKRRDALFDPLWKILSAITIPKVATTVLVLAAVLFGWSQHMRHELKIGDLFAGVPELRPDSRYNLDTAAVVSKFSIGTDILKVIAKTKENGCIDNRVMEEVDRFAWRMRNTEGVQSTLSLPEVSKIVFSAFNENSLKWFILPRAQGNMVVAVQPFTPSTGLLNKDCSAMPVFVFTADHKATTLDGIIASINKFKKEQPENSPVEFRLASGNIGVMAAANDVIKETEMPILGWVFLGIAVCVFLSFRSLAGMVCVLVPLAVVSWMSYAVMVFLDIGLKVATLPVAAFAAGIGVDYGIYIYSVLEEYVDKGMPLRRAYEETLHQTGKAVIFTALALSASVCTWIFSGLQFQVDMGILLTVMFLANAIAAVLLLPAFASFLMKAHPEHAQEYAAMRSGEQDHSPPKH